MYSTETPHSLPREVIDVPDEIRKAPPPALPEFQEPFTLRLVDTAGTDPEMITEWMSRPHLVQTWDQDWPLPRRRAYLDAQLAGAFSRPCVLGFDFAAIDRPDLGRRDVAYVELYRPARDEISTLYRAGAHDMGFHIATADPNLIGRGIISAWIGHLAAGVFAVEPQCRRLMCEPEHRNTPMRKALEKNGWQLVGEFDIRPTRRIALYTLPRTAEDLPALRP